MNDNPVAVTAVNFNVGVSASPTEVLPANQRRVYIIATLVSSGPVGLATAGVGDSSAVFWWLNTGQSQRFLKRDYGPLVTGEFWITDGNGNTPAVNLTLTEGSE